MLRENFEIILASSEYFSTTITPQMEERETALQEAKVFLQDVMDTEKPQVGVKLGVAKGGRQSAFSPTSWIRIFAQSHSPRAAEGYYLVYLFAADGSAVYLSLNQGTSELRSHHMRPITDSSTLRHRGAEARKMLSEFEANKPITQADVSIDLRWRSALSVGAESRRRIRNYEDANLYALRYARGALPTDAHLVQDLREMIPMLYTLYDIPGDGTDHSLRPQDHDGVQMTAHKAGPRLDAASRRAIEVHAEAAAESALPGWKVERVGHLKLGYDLRCFRETECLHVEVKGTTTAGHEVRLTPNEVRHVSKADCAAKHALFLLSHIELSTDETGTPVCEGGQGRLIDPWSIDPDSLTATEFAYRLPAPRGPLGPS